MILDTGICSVFRKTDSSGAGEMPAPSYTRIHLSWYGELHFETNPANPTSQREDVKTDARIRILQNRAIHNHDVVVLAQVDAVPEVIPGDDERVPVYEVGRAYHGADEDSGELITDLSLVEVEP